MARTKQTKNKSTGGKVKDVTPEITKLHVARTFTQHRNTGGPNQHIVIHRTNDDTIKRAIKALQCVIKIEHYTPSREIEKELSNLVKQYRQKRKASRRKEEEDEKPSKRFKKSV